MREQIEERIAALKAERAKGEAALAELVAKHGALRDTLLRIGGAIQVLEEVSARPAEANAGNARAFPSNDADASARTTNE